MLWFLKITLILYLNNINWLGMLQNSSLASVESFVTTTYSRYQHSWPGPIAYIILYYIGDCSWSRIFRDHNLFQVPTFVTRTYCLYYIILYYIGDCSWSRIYSRTICDYDLMFILFLFDPTRTSWKA